MATVEPLSHENNAPLTSRRERYRILSQRLSQWLSEPSAYDERVAAVLVEELKSSRTICRDSLREFGAVR